jgi:hypothetical protein
LSISHEKRRFYQDRLGTNTLNFNQKDRAGFRTNLVSQVEHPFCKRRLHNAGSHGHRFLGCGDPLVIQEKVTLGALVCFEQPRSDARAARL